MGNQTVQRLKVDFVPALRHISSTNDRRRSNSRSSCANAVAVHLSSERFFANANTNTGVLDWCLNDFVSVVVEFGVFFSVRNRHETWSVHCKFAIGSGSTSECGLTWTLRWHHVLSLPSAHSSEQTGSRAIDVGARLCWGKLVL